MKAAFGYFASFLALLTLATNGVLANETIAYTYDALGRLVAVSTTGTAASNGQNVSTTFDAAGNRTNYTVTGVGGGGGGAPTVSIANTTNGSEPSTNGTLTVTQSATSASNTVVALSYSTNSALNGTDFNGPSSVTIPAGSTSATVTLAVIDDTLNEGNETATVTLASVTSGTATIGTPNPATNTIADNDSGGGGGGSCTLIVPQSYSTSSNYQNAYSGLSGAGAGMSDGDYNSSTSVHGTNNEGNEYITMDLGSSQSVASVVVVPYTAWGASYTNGAQLQRSINGTTWEPVTTILGAANGTQTTISVGATARYVRLLMAASWLSVGDFKACSGGGGGAPTVSIANTANGSEPSTNGTLTVTQSATSATATTVSLSYSGSAINGTDFNGPSSVTIPANSTSATITLSVIDDTLNEGPETATVTLASVSSGTATIGTPNPATNTIGDNDSGGGTCPPITPPSGGYTASSTYGGYTGLSGNGAGMRDSSYNTSASVHGTTGSGSITLDLGSPQAVGSVAVVPITATFENWGAQFLNDAILERSTDGQNWTNPTTISGAVDEAWTYVSVNATTQFLRLSKSNWLGVGGFYASASTCGGGGGGTPTISIGSASVTEGGSLVFPVTLSASSTSTVTASYASASGTATSGSDFNAASGTVTISAGSTSGSITVTTIDDTSPEATETMSVTLSAPTNASLGTASGTGTINDNDSTSTANLAIGNASITEGGTLSFTVTRSGVTTSAVSASYATAGGTATSGSDFTAKTGTVSFAANVTTATVTVSTIDDTTPETAENMTVTLSSPSSGATITGANGTGTINDNDTAAPTVSIANTANGSEPSTNGTLTVTQSATSATATTVSLSYSGSAINGTDFNGPSSVTIPANSTSATITLSVIDDTLNEGPETATVTLASVSSGTATIGTPSSASNAIGDNDTGGFSAVGSYGLTAGIGELDLGNGTIIYFDGYIDAWFGALSNATLSGNYKIAGVYTTGGSLVLYITSPVGAALPPNSGWTSMTVPGLGTVSRSSMAYASAANPDGTGYATWTIANAGTIQSGTVVIQ